MWALNGGITLLLTLDQPENVVKRNGSQDQPTQSTSFQLSSIVGLSGLIMLDSALQENTFSNTHLDKVCCGNGLVGARMKCLSQLILKGNLRRQ